MAMAEAAYELATTDLSQTELLEAALSRGGRGGSPTSVVKARFDRLVACACRRRRRPRRGPTPCRKR